MHYNQVNVSGSGNTKHANTNEKAIPQALFQTAVVTSLCVFRCAPSYLRNVRFAHSCFYRGTFASHYDISEHCALKTQKMLEESVLGMPY